MTLAAALVILREVRAGLALALDADSRDVSRRAVKKELRRLERAIRALAGR